MKRSNNRNEKLVALIFITVCLLLFFVILQARNGANTSSFLYQTSPSIFPSPTPNIKNVWERYFDSKYSIEIQYPSSWKSVTDDRVLKEDNDIFYSGITGKRQTVGTELFDGASLEIAIPKRIFQQDIQTWLRNSYAGFSEYEKPVEIGWQTFGSNKFYVIQELGYGSSKIYFLKKGDMLYKITADAVGEDKKKYEENIEASLSSFRVY